jgi:hypothetical protein
VWFAPVLLAAAKLDPKKMIPQIGHLVIEHDADFRSNQFDIDLKRVNEMFGERTRELLRLLSREVDASNESEKEFLRNLREKAKAYLSKTV